MLRRAKTQDAASSIGVPGDPDPSSADPADAADAGDHAKSAPLRGCPRIPRLHALVLMFLLAASIAALRRQRAAIQGDGDRGAPRATAAKGGRERRPAAAVTGGSAVSSTRVGERTTRARAAGTPWQSSLKVADENHVAVEQEDQAAPGAPAAEDEDAPSEFAHSHDPPPTTGHDEVHRPFGGRGCTFKLCNAVPGEHIVAGAPSDTLPLMYLIVPHRNRVDNIVRLLTSLNNATTPAQRACLCVLLTDFNTSTAVVPPWKNVHCLVSYRERHGIYMDDESFAPPRELRRGELARLAQTYAGPAQCPDVRIDRQSLTGPSRGSWGRVTEHFPPAHLDISGLTGRQSVRHALAFYDGESAIIDGNIYVRDPRIKFSRAGGIMAGVDAIRTPPVRSLLFICDADMIIRPGFMEHMLATPRPGAVVFMPIIWSMCWGAAVEDGPKRRNWRSSRKGFWRPGGRGMVVAYLSDILAVGGMR